MKLLLPSQMRTDSVIRQCSGSPVATPRQFQETSPERQFLKCPDVDESLSSNEPVAQLETLNAVGIRAA